MKKSLIEKLMQEISENNAKIIDDFVKVYIASRWEDYFSKQKKIDFERIELVINNNFTANGSETIVSCRLKKGKLKNLK
ncbi:hypothetical protein M0R01_04585 [bacterium]|nr:hypothetical protein [bacterium]